MFRWMWEGGKERKDRLLKWEEVIKLKEYGGLGIDRIRKRNMGLIGKWLWRFATEMGSLLQSIIHSRYGSDANGWDCNLTLPLSHSLIRKNIIQIAPLFYSHSHFMIGNGTHIKFWKDLWWETQTLAILSHLYHISSQKEAAYVKISSSTLEFSFP